MPRVNQAQITRTFALFCKVMGMRVADSYKDVGGYVVDKGYGGYRIELISGPTGGVRTPFGSTRYKGDAFITYLHGLMDAQRHLRGEEISRQMSPPRFPGDMPNPPGKIVHRVGSVKVYWRSEYKEYEVRDKGESEGYFTTDKQDAIDTANNIANGLAHGEKGWE